MAVFRTEELLIRNYTQEYEAVIVILETISPEMQENSLIRSLYMMLKRGSQQKV